MQYGRRPQVTAVAPSAAARSPGLTPSTRAPVATTVPESLVLQNQRRIIAERVVQLLTVRRNGRRIEVAAQPARFAYLYNRVQPLWGAAWASRLPPGRSLACAGRSSMGHPLKPPPFARQKFTLDDTQL